jgi:hypothetical protein
MPQTRFSSVVDAMVGASLAAVTACAESTSPSASHNSAPSLAVTQQNAVSASAPVRFHPRAGEVTITRSVSGGGNVHLKFSSVEEACIEFAFSGDLLTSGDHFNIWIDGSDAGGFIGSVPQANRTLCWNRIFHPEIVADLLDGKAKLKFTMLSGSVRLRSATLTISGSPR